MRSKSMMVMVGVAAMSLLLPLSASADHSWGSYHWERSGELQLDLADNLDQTWQFSFAQAIDDWNLSLYVETTAVPGSADPASCNPTSGRIEVCNAEYGSTGWLGIAQIWARKGHISQGVVKVNDTYYAPGSVYDTQLRRDLVMCQEIGHIFGLGHQDENHNNASLGTCMDYTAVGGESDLDRHPNQHDYDQLATIYTHDDASKGGGKGGSGGDGPGGCRGKKCGSAHPVFGEVMGSSAGGHRVTYRTMDRGFELITHVTYAHEAGDDHHHDH